MHDRSEHSTDNEETQEFMVVAEGVKFGPQRDD